MLVIDGSEGEGGGQILRTALGLSLVTGKPFRIEKIRAGRAKPGLRKQHLTCVEAARRVGSAYVEGAKEGSLSLSFEPHGIVGGRFRFSTGSAGSTTLVLQTILPALLRATEPTELELEGGTHNPMAPPWDFLNRSWLPLLRRMGAEVTGHLERPGFFPRGGGRILIKIQPGPLRRLDLQRRGELISVKTRAVVANLPRTIADRELAVCRRLLNLRPGEGAIEEYPGCGPGNVVFVDVESERVTETFAAFGEKGTKAEAVAEDAAQQAARYLQASHPVGEYLADQLFIPMALAGGGSFKAGELSLHSTTNIATVKKFLNVDVHLERQDGETLVIVSESL